LAVASASAWPASAYAEPAAQKSIAVFIEGQDASSVREDVLAAAPKGVTEIDAKAFSQALSKAGQSKLGNALTQQKGRDKVIERVQKAAKDVKADAAIVGVVQRWAGKPRVYLVWVDPRKETPLVDEPAALTGSSDDRRAAISAVLSPAMREFAPGSEEEKTEQPDEQNSLDEENADKSKEDAPAPGSRERHLAGSSIFSIELGFETGGRSFKYSDGLSPDTTRDYSILGAPMGAVELELYPAAGTGIRVLKDLGITGGYARAFGLTSATEGGEPVPTTYQRISAALRGRIPINGPAGPVIGLSGGIRILTFDIEEPPLLKGETPDASYFALRGGVDTRIPIGPVGLLLGFDWLQPLQSGEVYSRFTGARVYGLNASGGVAVQVGLGFELRLLAQYSRFFSDFNPVQGDAHVAGGALDEFFGLRLGAAYVE
jgi:hypothetical protein